MKNKNKVTVIGAGASGMLAALAANASGADVTIIERNQSEGKKLAATGNGRCNFTNADADSLQNYYSADNAVAASVLSRFTVADILNKFDSMGITPALEEDGKYFPLSGQASSVVELLCRELKRSGISVIYQTLVTDIDTSGERLGIITDGGRFETDRLIIAAGGMASPSLGSDGNAYALAEKLGHKITPIFPVIVQLKTKDGFYKRLNGLRVNAAVTLTVEGKRICTECGDLMFYDYGLSGSTVFKLSCDAAYALAQGKRVGVSLDLAPMYTAEALNKYITARCAASSCTAEELLVGFINKKLIQLVLEASGINGGKRADMLGSSEINAMCRAISDMRFTVTDTKGWDNAQATAGGISLDEVDSETLRSKFDNRVGFCGEILDVVGKCGGFNLTWAWASGFVCGSSILK